MADTFIWETTAFTGTAQDPRVAYRKIFFLADGARRAPQGRSQIYVRQDHSWEITPDLDPFTRGWIGTPINQQAPKNLLIFCHGWNGEANNFDFNRTKTTRNMIMERGDFIVVQCHAGTQNWGNQPALLDYKAAYDLCTRYFNIRHVFTMGQSLGGIAALLLKARMGVPVLGNIHIGGWSDLHVAWLNYDGPRIAYGLTGFPPAGEAEFQSVTDGHDPQNDYDATDFTNFWFRAYASPTDTATRKADNADAFAAKILGEAQEAVVISVTGAHLSDGYYRPADISAFIDRAIAWADKEEPPPEPGPGDQFLADVYQWDGTSMVRMQVQQHLGDGIFQNVDFYGVRPEE